MRVAVIGCCKQKRPSRGPAREVYCSRHFHAALSWARRCSSRVFIASTALGLITPDTVIDPYDHSFSTNRAAEAPERFEERERAVWGERVARTLRAVTRPVDEFVFILGKQYWSAIVPHITNRYSVPFEHMRLATRTAAMLKEIA